MRNLVLLLILFAGCSKEKHNFTKQEIICKDFEGTWYCINQNIDS